MGARPFTSESYARRERPALGRDVLASAGLAPAPKSPPYRSCFPAGRRPARACGGVNGLAYDARIEIDVACGRP